MRRPFTADSIGLNKTIIRTGTTTAGRNMATLMINFNQTNTATSALVDSIKATMPTMFVSKIRILMQRRTTKNRRKDLLIGLKSDTLFRLTCTAAAMTVQMLSKWPGMLMSRMDKPICM